MVVPMSLEEILDLRQKLEPSPKSALVPGRRGREQRRLWQVLLRGTAKNWFTVIDLK